MDELLNMGFSHDVASQALAATGGKSTLEATEWILNQKQNSNPSLPPGQPRLDRYFQSSRPSPNCKTQLLISSGERTDVDDESSLKRRKLTPPLREKANSLEPLSERMRPKNIDDVVGQDHLTGKNSLLRSALNLDRLPSIVLWGPPGTGKTSIARAIANSSTVSYRFVSLSAVTAGVKDVREAVEEARKFKQKRRRTVLFVDEVHRFNKSQQDSFLPVIEDGSIVFMGATTENPSFHLITPLLSRCRVLSLNKLQPEHVAFLLKRAVADSENGLLHGVEKTIKVEEEAVDFLSLHCDGDARVALNALEISGTTAAARILKHQSNKIQGPDYDSSPKENKHYNGDGEEHEKGADTEDPSSVAVVTVDDVKEALQCKHLAYDKDGEEHYNLISALHKSMRGNDANAAIYWLARMLEGGEEPLYIARRLVRFASEDIGLADPYALVNAIACYQACHFLGMPECNVNLAQCVAYLAFAPKSVAVYRAIEEAQKLVRNSGGQNPPVPLHLRNAPTKLMKEFGYGKDYIYTPDNPSLFQTFLPPSLQGYKFLD